MITYKMIADRRPKMILGRTLLLLLTLFAMLGQSSRAASSVTHWGFTWSFSADRQVGTFVNGEPWVVGPVTITAIGRDNGMVGPDADTYNGSMVNPVPSSRQGFSKFPYNTDIIGYDPNLNVAIRLPVTVQIGDSLCSSMHGSSESFVKRLSTLTVVGSPPPAGSFRPTPYGPGPHLVKFNKSQVNFNLFKNLAPVENTPPVAYINSILPSGTWMEWTGNFSGAGIGPSADIVGFGGGRGGLLHSNYGREIAIKWGTVALWLNLNHSAADKEYAIIQTIQAGIDIAEYARLVPGGFYHDGGHKLGRKLPVLLAGLLLNDAPIKATAANRTIFQEDQQLWFVTQADVGRVVHPTNETYLQSDVGLAEWGIRHLHEPYNDSRAPNAPYRGVCGPAMTGPWLAAYIMGIQSAWNHSAAFSYMDRAKGYFGTGSAFTEKMWEVYRSGGVVVPPTPKVSSPVITPATETFDSGQTVSISSATSSATIHYTVDGSTPTSGSPIYSGPFTVSSSLTISAIAYASNMTASDLTSSTLTISVVPPSFSPSGGVFSEPLFISLNSASSGATIHYTIDGSDPTTNSPVYGESFRLSSTTSVKAIAVKSGLPQSVVTTSYYIFGAYPGLPTWTNIPTQSKTGNFTIKFEMIAAGDGVDSVVGLSDGPADAYTDLACIVRFNTQGFMDARNGPTYQSTNSLAYHPGVAYAVTMVVDIALQKYDVTVKPFGGSDVLVASQFSFRSEQSSVSSLGNLGFVSAVGAFSLANLGIDLPPPNPPDPPPAPKGLRVIPNVPF